MQITLKQARLTKKHQQALQDMYSDILACKHDFKHLLQAIKQMIPLQPPRAAEYLTKRKTNERNTFAAGSVTVDALFTAKMLVCKNKRIDFELSHDPLNTLPSDEADFCAIVGNLLNNAMEGALRMEDDRIYKWIHLSFQRILGYLFHPMQEYNGSLNNQQTGKEISYIKGKRLRTSWLWNYECRVHCLEGRRFL